MTSERIIYGLGQNNFILTGIKQLKINYDLGIKSKEIVIFSANFDHV